MNHHKISNSMPFKFVKNAVTSIHFGEMWACEQIRSHQIKAKYRQKWNKADTTKLQCESSLFPDQLQLRNLYNGIVKTFDWLPVVDGITYKLYETTYDVSDVPDGVYFLYQPITLMGWKYLSEPIHIATSWPNTLLFRYRHTYNKDDVGWTTGIECKFRCEADIQDYEPDTERNMYKNQIKSTTLLDSIAGDQFQLYVGDAPGVAEWVVWKLDRIYTCNKVFANDKQYSAKQGSSIKMTRNRNYSLVGASLDIVPTTNSQSLEFADSTPLFGGIITAYNIETGFFGPSGIVPVLEVEENG